MDNHPILHPKAILDRRTIQIEPTPTDQVLIQWEDTPPEEAAWENIDDLANKSILKNDRMLQTRTKLNQLRILHLLSLEAQTTTEMLRPPIGSINHHLWLKDFQL